jgi:5-deoxy-D-glucuronate isomerase
MHSTLLIRNPQGFDNGYSSIISLDEKNAATGMNFGILKLKANVKMDLTSPLETAYLLMHGEVIFYYDDKTIHAKRDSLFDEAPSVIHFASGSKVALMANTDCELAVLQAENEKTFATEFFDASNLLELENRGQGILEDTSYRIVRTIFNAQNRKNAVLVLGEVVTMPGRWSSYPPHHHPQPEIYHYRFTEPQGYGHSELGDEIFKVRQYDTIKILDNKDHPQVAAPGYAMYYIWAIRHLPNNLYTVPEFTENHAWTKDRSANMRAWKIK